MREIQDHHKVNAERVKPFLRWAGGKNWLLPQIEEFLPKKFAKYHEPFLGGGSVFFYLNPTKPSYLYDTNEALINAFMQVRDDLDAVIKVLMTFKNEKEEYYEIRSRSYADAASRAAQFLYLNRTNFNGIYRVNLSGVYNVPYGFKKYRQLFELENLSRASSALQNAELRVADFGAAMELISEDDLVFLDPPYTHSHIKNGFVKYNESLFSWADQKRLAKFIEMIKSVGAYYILTNARHERVADLYGEIDEPHPVTRFSRVGGKKARRGIIEEYLFTNCVDWEM